MNPGQQIYIASADLRKRLGGISRHTLGRWQKRNTNPFPAPAIHGSGFQNRWAVADVEKWEADQKALTIETNRAIQAA